MSNTADPAPEMFSKRAKLLVVDDQPINILAIRGVFKDLYDVYMATDGPAAIEQCQAIMPDLILLDVMMPGMDGHEVCRRLKENTLTESIPIIFLTAQRSEEEEARGFELGAVDFISKPFNAVLVRARVRNHIDLKHKSDLLKSFALLDGMTGIANRRRFDQELQVDWLQCARLQQALSVIMIDVDYFKRYNDAYGHLAGDDCLRQIAQALHGVLHRPYDLLARYGGEEFVCLLPDTGLDGAQHLAQELLERVQQLGLAHTASEVAPFVTISLGVASTLPNREQDPQTLIQAADQQLYCAKQNGRARFSAVTLP